MRPAQGMPTTPLLPVLPRGRGRIDEDSRKVRDFYTQAKRENNVLESNFHVKARIGFKRARAGGIRLRPLDAGSTPGARHRLPPPGPPLRPAAAARAEPGPASAPPASAAAQAPQPAAQAPTAAAALAAGAEPRPPAAAQGPDVEALRQMTASILLQAEEDGSLCAALGELRAEAARAEAAQGADVEALRQMTARVLLQAEEDGSLGAALGELRADAALAGAAQAPSEDVAQDVAVVGAPSRAPTRTSSLQVAHDLAQEVSRVAVEEVMLSIRGENPMLASPRNVSVFEDE